MKKFETAFTLAEVLITLGIIGVVAALIMPALITNINERVNSSREANIAYKVTQATDKMQSLGLLNGSYKSTDEFVDELQKHLKIAKRCDANHIADCWPTETVIPTGDESYEVKDALTGIDLKVRSNKTGNVGLVLADGASIILTYYEKSNGIEETEPIKADKKTLPVGFGKSEEFAYTSSSTASIDFVMDVNGKKGPNSEVQNGKYYDIRSFKIARFGKCDAKIPGVGCVVNLGSSYECLVKGTEDYDKYDNGAWSPSCWAGAKKACDDIGMTLVNPNQLRTTDSKKSKYSNLPQSGWFWTNEDNGGASGFAILFATATVYQNKGLKHGAMCVGN